MNQDTYNSPKRRIFSLFLLLKRGFFMNTIFKQKNTHPFSNVANRLDRLPISRVHFQVLTALGIVYFFDLADLFTLSNVAPALIEHWGIPLSTIANVTVRFVFRHVFRRFTGRTAVRSNRPQKSLKSICLCFLNRIAMQCCGMGHSIFNDIPFPHRIWRCGRHGHYE